MFACGRRNASPALFDVIFRVIASQSADWRGNLKNSSIDCHVLAMTKESKDFVGEGFPFPGFLVTGQHLSQLGVCVQNHSVILAVQAGFQSVQRQNELIEILFVLGVVGLGKQSHILRLALGL